MCYEETKSRQMERVPWTALLTVLGLFSLCVSVRPRQQTNDWRSHWGNDLCFPRPTSECRCKKNWNENFPAELSLFPDSSGKEMVIIKLLSQGGSYTEIYNRSSWKRVRLYRRKLQLNWHADEDNLNKILLRYFEKNWWSNSKMHVARQWAKR